MFLLWLLAHLFMNPDRALFMALVVTPWIVAGPLYVPGWSNTPGTALVLLSMGLMIRHSMVAAGITLGLLLFTKLAVFPIGFVALFVLALIASRRRDVLRGLVAFVISSIVGFVILFVSGALGGYFEMIQRNRTYASDAMIYFGFEPSFAGHVAKVQEEIPSASNVAVIAIAAILALSSVLIFTPRLRRGNFNILVMWFAFAVLVLATLIPDTWVFLGWVAIVLFAAFLVSGWGSFPSVVERWNQATQGFADRLAASSDVPIDARLLNTVPLQDFTFVRLETNDDDGFLRDVRPDARLACSTFHFYDFSPTSRFAEAWECLDDADVVLLTDNFVVFGNGGKAAEVQPVLG